MQTKLNPYISFNGNARQAMEFYETVFGGTLNLKSFKESGASQSEADENLIMHGELVTAGGLTLMGADTPPSMDYSTGTNFSVSLSGDDKEELSGYYDRLAVGGTVAEPLTTAPWGDTFGIVADQFGIMWMVNISGAQA